MFVLAAVMCIYVTIALMSASLVPIQYAADALKPNAENVMNHCVRGVASIVLFATALCVTNAA